MERDDINDCVNKQIKQGSKQVFTHNNGPQHALPTVKSGYQSLFYHTIQKR